MDKYPLIRKGLAVGIILLFSNITVSSLDVTIKDYNTYEETLSPILHWIPHRPIWISGNEDITRWNGVRGGSGTKDDPYIISGWRINGIFQYIFDFDVGFGLVIMSTDKYIVIRDNVILNWIDRLHGFPSHTAILLYNTKNVIIENNYIRRCNRAIHFLEENTGTIIRNNSISDVDSYTIIGEGGIIENNTLVNCKSAIDCGNSVIQYNLVKSSDIGIGTFGPCYISHNDLIDNGIGIGCYWHPHACTIIDNKIYSNNNGIYLIDGSKPVIHFNNFDFNEGGVSYLGVTVVNATLNWWGAANGPGGSGPGDGDAVSDYVDYNPWLTSPNPNAGR